MLSVKAQYKDGVLTVPEGVELPQGIQDVIVTFLDEDDSELHPEWQAEIDSRIKSIEKGTAILHDGEDVINEIKKELAGWVIRF